MSSTATTTNERPGLGTAAEACMQEFLSNGAVGFENMLRYFHEDGCFISDYDAAIEYIRKDAEFYANADTGRSDPVHSEEGARWQEANPKLWFHLLMNFMAEVIYMGPVDFESFNDQIFDEYWDENGVPLNETAGERDEREEHAKWEEWDKQNKQKEREAVEKQTDVAMVPMLKVKWFSSPEEHNEYMRKRIFPAESLK